MPKLKPATQRARREHILDAAEVCFARAGFHRTTMQDICKEALISPGALYVYFSSKEDLIAGIGERDRADFAERFAELSAAPDFMKALASLGEHYFEEEPAYKRAMCIEIGLESTRNAKVGEIYRAVDRYVADSFEKLFAAPRSRGAHRARARHSNGRQGVLRHRRRAVLPPRGRSRFRRQDGHTRRDEPGAQAAQSGRRSARRH